MIAPVAPTAELRREADRQRSRELLRTVMTERFRRYLMKHALKWTRHNWDAAQDLVQEAFLAMLRSDSYDPAKSKPTTFAFAHLKWQFMRAKTFQATRPPLRHLNCEPKSRPLMASPETREVIQRIQAAIGQLPPSEHSVVVSRMNGMTLQSIAVQRNLCRERIRQIEEKAMDRLADMPLPV
jgi:RNA polymerase sigma factor (sigma-70 family)